MDISSERLRQEIPKSDIFDFVNTPSDPLKTLGLESHNSSATETKETNNNHFTIDMSNYGSDIWPTIDSSMLEELNCWTQEAAQSAKVDNTDGAIYTLTVLNGSEQTHWFKQEEKEEKLPNNNALDIDSLLNVVPANFANNFPEVKTEYNLEDSGFEEKKEEMCNNIVTEIVLTNNSGFNNNNEWKQGANTSVEVDSLLRNALQGKTLVRYNGIKKEPEIKTEEEEKIMNIENPMLYENPNIIDSDNPSSAHSMDDLFLNNLDVSYPEDYEKLKRIESEVAESVEKFCMGGSYLASGSQLHVAPIIGLVAKPAKKYTKRSKSTTPTAGTSTGVRKERSLHYCSICSKGFKDKYSVNVHIRTHTGEKPFTCSLCGKSFRQKAHLAKHYQTHMAQAKNGLTNNSKAPKNLISSS